MKSPFKNRHDEQLDWNQALPKIVNRFYSYKLEFKTSLLWLLCYLPSHSFRKLVLKLAGVSLGRKSYIHIGCRIYEPKNVSVGTGTINGDHATLDGRDKLVIGDYVDIASEVMIYNSKHDLEDPDFKAIEAEVNIGDYVFIGPRAIILPGVRVGKGAVVAAGAVVTKDVADFSIVGGVPAEVIGERKNKNLYYRLGRARLFQ